MANTDALTTTAQRSAWWQVPTQVLLAATVLAVAAYVVELALYPGESLPLIRVPDLLTQLIHWYVWGGLLLVIVPLLRKISYERIGRFPAVALIFLMGIPGALLHGVVEYSAIYLVWIPLNFQMISSFGSFMSDHFITDYFTFWGIAGIGLSFDYFGKYRDREVVAARLSSQLANAQLATLRMQLRPHFLFNTLNGIATLMRRDVDQAEQMLVWLGELLRATLDLGEQNEIHLGKELEILHKYLQIEQVRFPERLQFQVDVPVDLQNAVVPALILQPLVENSIIHGVAPLSRPVMIQISASRKDNQLCLVVHDNGLGAQNMVAERIGLSNTRQRLRQLYGLRADCQILSSDGFTVILNIPFRIGQK